MGAMSLRPVVDLNRCEGKAVCVEVCPWHVFEIRQIPSAQTGPLSLAGRLRRVMHGGRQAVAIRAADCHACGLCVKECPEEAIRLRDSASDEPAAVKSPPE
jgi:4Fe-4S ferredoxin